MRCTGSQTRTHTPKLNRAIVYGNCSTLFKFSSTELYFPFCWFLFLFPFQCLLCSVCFVFLFVFFFHFQYYVVIFAINCILFCRIVIRKHVWWDMTLAAACVNSLAYLSFYKSLCKIDRLSEHIKNVLVDSVYGTKILLLS